MENNDSLEFHSSWDKTNKISSFKRNILETKTDTLGGVYPRFYKNANRRFLTERGERHGT